jgi:Poxvirus A32 protein
MPRYEEEDEEDDYDDFGDDDFDDYDEDDEYGDEFDDDEAVVDDDYHSDGYDSSDQSRYKSARAAERKLKKQAGVSTSGKEKFEVFRLDPGMIRGTHGLYMFIGQTNSGKTTALVDVLRTKQWDFKRVLVFAGTDESRVLFQKHVPSSFIHPAYDDNILRVAMLTQEAAVAEHGRARAPPLLVVLDDVAYDKQVYSSSRVFRFMLKNGRHLNITCMITMQYYTDLASEHRSQAAFVFLQRQPNRSLLKDVFHSCNTVFPNIQTFQRIHDICTAEYGTLVLCNAPSKGDMSEFSSMVFHYKATPDVKFKVNRGGSMWQFHADNYDRKHRKRRARQLRTRAEQVHKSNVALGASAGGGIMDDVRTAAERKRLSGADAKLMREAAKADELSRVCVKREEFYKRQQKKEQVLRDMNRVRRRM